MGKFLFSSTVSCHAKEPWGLGLRRFKPHKECKMTQRRMTKATHTQTNTRTKTQARTPTQTHTQSVSFTHSLSISNLIPAPAEMEKPRTFHCGQCGKTISQSGELRTHQCVQIEVKLFIKSLSSLPICKDVLLFEPRTTTSSGTLILNSDVTVAFVLETLVPPTPATSWGTGNSGNVRRTLAQWKGSIRDMYLTTLVASNGKAITKEFGLCRYGSATSCQSTSNGKSIEKWLAEQKVAK